ncbi:MAG: nitroreductase, partial [Negativicutes bacterium]|nr:nitroreductase [Negativicutes bacterium]
MRAGLEKLHIGPAFMEYTKYKYQTEPTDQAKLLPQPELTDAAPTDRPIFDLPQPQSVAVNQIDLTDAINKRVSLRKYAEKPLTLAELSYLLWSTQGIKQISKRPATLRTV